MKVYLLRRSILSLAISRLVLIFSCNLFALSHSTPTTKIKHKTQFHSQILAIQFLLFANVQFTRFFFLPITLVREWDLLDTVVGAKECASKLIHWKPKHGRRKHGRPKLTYLDLSKKDTGLETAELFTAIQDRTLRRVITVRDTTQEKKEKKTPTNCYAYCLNTRPMQVSSIVMLVIRTVVPTLSIKEVRDTYKKRALCAINGIICHHFIG